MRSPLVVSFGAGIDSMAMLIGFKHRGIVPDAIVFSDTRGEKPETYSYMDRFADPMCKRFKFPRITRICRADFGRGNTGDQSLEEECLRLGNMPSRAFGFGTCADKWKIDPFRWWAREFAAEWYPVGGGWAELQWPLVRCIGYEFGEEYRISDVVDDFMAKRYPLIEWRMDRDQCERIIDDEGLPLPPKSACFYCPSSKKHEIVALKKRHPDLMERALKMERQANETGRWKIKGLGRHWSWASFLEATEAQRELFPSGPEGCSVCYDGED